jgi:hypothetical protein
MVVYINLMADLDRGSIQQAFEELGERLARRRPVGEIAVIGGAAMILRFHIDRVTQYVDASVNMGLFNRKFERSARSMTGRVVAQRECVGLSVKSCKGR